MPDFTQNFNRYSYALNNPLRYRDESGEFAITGTVLAITIGVAALIGAAAGAYEGYCIAKSNGATGWGMAGYIIGGGLIGGVAGAAAGAVGLYVGAAVGIGGFIGGAAAGAASGFVGGAINGFGMTLLGGGDSVQAFKMSAFQALTGAAIGAAMGGLIQGSIDAAHGRNFWNGSVKVLVRPSNPVLLSSRMGLLLR